MHLPFCTDLTITLARGVIGGGRGGYWVPYEQMCVHGTSASDNHTIDFMIIVLFWLVLGPSHCLSRELDFFLQKWYLCWNPHWGDSGEFGYLFF